MKQYGSAVLTVLQAQHKSIEEVGELVHKRRLQAFIKGGMPEEWLNCFWKNIAIMEASRINAKNLIFYDPVHASRLWKFLKD